MGLWSSITKLGKDTWDTVYDFGASAIEFVGNVGKTGVDVVKDGFNVVGSFFTPASTKTALDNMGDNFLDNVSETGKDLVSGTANAFSNSVQVLGSSTQVIMDTVDTVYKPGEDNFKGVDNVLGTVDNITTGVDLAYDNKEAIMDLLGTGISTIWKGVTPEIISTAYAEAGKKDNFKDKFTTFFGSLLMNSGQELLNDMSTVDAGKPIADSDLTAVKPTNNLTNKDLLILSSIGFTGMANINNKGKQLGDVVNEMKKSVGRSENEEFTPDDIEKLREQKFAINGELTNEEFSDILNEIAATDRLSNLTILDNTDQEQNYITATTYGTLNNGKLEGSATVVFRGTDSAQAWLDDFQGLTETDTKMQQAANDYIFSQINGAYQISDITVTGQSKGGNLAEYVTLLNEEAISNCVAFSEQGFSEDFIKKYMSEIMRTRHKMTSISSYVDPINSTLTNIAGTAITVDTKIDPESRNLENIFNFVLQSHTAGAMYEANKNGWIQKDKSDLSKLITTICSSIEDLKPPVKEFIVDLAGKIADEHLAAGSEIGDKDVEEFGSKIKLDFGLFLRQTAEGFNVYHEELSKDNTVATLDPYGNILTGNLEMIANLHDVSLEDILNAIVDKLSSKDEKDDGGFLGLFNFNKDEMNH